MIPNSKQMKITRKVLDQKTRQFMRERPKLCVGFTYEQIYDVVLNTELQRHFEFMEKKDNERRPSELN